MPRLTHLDAEGKAHMVDVGEKPETERVAMASSVLTMSAEAFEAATEGRGPKGDVFAVARIAAIQAAKRTAELIPLCHPLALTQVTVDFEPRPRARAIRTSVTVRTRGRTGVEMEALTAVSVAALTLYDMLKAVDHAMVIGPTQLEAKRGGVRGDFVRPVAAKTPVARRGRGTRRG